MSSVMPGVGESVAGYRIDDVLGSGGMGVVYEATQIALDRKVALKVLAPHLSDDLVFRERFRREGVLQAALEHPHVVTVYEAGESDAGLYLAMRLVRGTNLKELLAGGSLAPEQALELLAQIADALDAAHAQDVVHRDVKPPNILVDENGKAFLADFGLTRGTSQNTLTRTGSYVGTLDYVSPEQIRGEMLTARSDLYALGAVLYECLTGSVPYPRESEAALLYAHLSDSPPPPSAMRPGLPPALDAVAARALAKDPADRYSTATALVDAAREALASEPGAAELPAHHARPPRGATVIDAIPSVAVRPLPQLTDRQPFVWPLVAAAVALALVAGAAAFAVGHASATVHQPALRTATAGAIHVSYPPGWSRGTKPPVVPGLDLQDPLVLNLGPLTFVAGSARSLDPALVPPTSTHPTVAVLAAGRAYRYAALQPDGSRQRLTLFALPTAAGYALAACIAPIGSDARPCEAVAATLQLSAGQARQLGPTAAYASSLGTTLARLDARRTRDRALLARATSPRTQQTAVAALARDERSAAAAIRALQPSVGAAAAQRALTAALDRTAAAYTALARAAAHGAGYAKARTHVASAEVAAEQALAGFAAAGYDIRP
jgi:serine/threonine-protein kinase